MSTFTRNVYSTDENAGRMSQFAAQKPTTQLGAQRAPLGGVMKPVAAAPGASRAAFREVSNVARAPLAPFNPLQKQVRFYTLFMLSYPSYNHPDEVKRQRGPRYGSS